MPPNVKPNFLVFIVPGIRSDRPLALNVDDLSFLLGGILVGSNLGMSREGSTLLLGGSNLGMGCSTLLLGASNSGMLLGGSNLGMICEGSTLLLMGMLCVGSTLFVRLGMLLRWKGFLRLNVPIALIVPALIVPPIEGRGGDDSCSSTFLHFVLRKE